MIINVYWIIKPPSRLSLTHYAIDFMADYAHQHFKLHGSLALWH